LVNRETSVVICGAGIAGVSAAYHLAVQRGLRDILLVDERAPFSLTSDKSTECYRNWWPGPGDAMVAFMNRSIDLLEDLAQRTGNLFHLNRRGYLYLTAEASKIPDWIREAEEPARLGAGSLRIHNGQAGDPPYQPAPPEGFAGQPSGADLLLDPALLREHFPYLSQEVVAALHVRRAGWFSAQQLGAYLLEQARAAGVRFLQARVTGVEVSGGRVRAVCLGDGSRIATRNFVNAAGPLIAEVGRLLGVELPVFSELHLKVAFNDQLGVVPRHAPLLIWTDRQRLPWSAEEVESLVEEESLSLLLEEFPAGAHTRPEGSGESPVILMLWEYHSGQVEPVWPVPLDPLYPEIALRGLAAMLPGLRAYFDRLPRPVLDGGYYTKTRENRPLIGPLPVEGAYLVGALSGYGLMAAMAAGELLAAHLTGSPLPGYAQAFSLARYQDPNYLQLLQNWGDSGQL
jgi:glycine/D-amino acid oxidase-like deaminating enzyme